MAARTTAQTQTPATLSRTLTTRLHRAVTAKAIRSFARDSIARFGDDKYTAHVYTTAETKAIETAFAKRGERSKAQATTPKGKVKASAKRATRVHPMAGDAPATV